jgi:hypothetical protein
VNTDAASLPGGSRNQDAYAVLDQAVIVLDGATSYPPTDPDRDGGWFAHVLLDSIGQRLPLGGSLADCLADAIANVRDTESLEPGGPSSTVLLARLGEDGLDMLVLGDSTLVIEHQNRTLDILTDNRLDAIALHERKTYRHRLSAGNGFDAQHQQLLAQIQDRERAARNQPAGYWIAESNPDAAKHAITHTVPLSDVRGLLMLTDGATAGVTRYQHPKTWPDLVNQIDTLGTAAVLDEIQRVEATDPAGQRWPRSKAHDDKSAVRLRL